MKLIILQNYKEVLNEFNIKDLKFLGAFDSDAAFSSLVHSLAFVSIGYSVLVLTLSDTNKERFVCYGLCENC